MGIKIIRILFLLSISVSCAISQESTEVDVLVLGAGVAGVFAASKLEENGVSFLVLEGTNRIGGRMKSANIGNYTVEMGCLFLHGYENFMLPLADNYGLNYKLQDDSWYVSDKEGNNVTEEAERAYESYERAADALDEYAETLREKDWPDINRLGGLSWFGFTPKSPVEAVIDYFGTDFEVATPPDSNGVKFYNVDRTYEKGDANYIITQQENGGFVHLLRSHMEQTVSDWESKVRLNAIVDAVNYTDSGVTVHTSQGIFTAKYVIATFSLGVLQHGTVQFNPPLPTWKQQAIFAFQFISYYHFYLRFPEEEEWFVPEVEWILYSDDRRGYFPVWQNFEMYLPGCRILQGTVTHFESYRLNNLTDEEVLAEAMAVLRKMFGDTIPDAVEIVVPKWIDDPFSYGSYSNMPVGYTKEQFDAVAAPVKRLHFAGEAYSWEYPAYIHGAAESGQHVAEKVSRCLNAPPGSPEHDGCISFMPSYLARGCTYELALNYETQAKEDDGSCWLVDLARTSSHAPITVASVLVTCALLQCAHFLIRYSTTIG